MKELKLLNIEFTNETLLLILPFNTGYLLRPETDTPCEHSVKLAMMLHAIGMEQYPHKMTDAPLPQ
jgi:hypothetical protein